MIHATHHSSPPNKPGWWVADKKWSRVTEACSRCEVKEQRVISKLTGTLSGAFFFFRLDVACTVTSISHFCVCLSDGIYFQYKAILLVARVPLFSREGGQNLSKEKTGWGRNEGHSKCFLCGTSAPHGRIWEHDAAGLWACTSASLWVCTWASNANTVRCVPDYTVPQACFCKYA